MKRIHVQGEKTRCLLLRLGCPRCCNGVDWPSETEGVCRKSFFGGVCKKSLLLGISARLAPNGTVVDHRGEREQETRRARLCVV